MKLNQDTAKRIGDFDMKKTLRSFLAAAFVSAALFSCSTPGTTSLPQVYSHRGCWLEGLVPENSVSGIHMARRFGYPAIECDVKYTLDSVMVVMHDATINRTMRNAADYSEIETPVKVRETLFKDLRENYVFASDDPAERVCIPTLEELLLACRECGIHPVLHSEVEESYSLAQEIMGDNWTAFSTEYDKMACARSVSGCPILWDPGTLDAASTVAKLDSLGGACGMSTMKWKMLDADYISVIRNAGYNVQSSIFPTPHEADAVSDGASIILSDFCWFQQEGRKPAYRKRCRGLDLKAGESLSYAYPEQMYYGAMTLNLSFTGSVEVLVNGGRSYTFNSSDYPVRDLGFRFSRTKPEISIKALEDSRIESCEYDVYDI